MQNYNTQRNIDIIKRFPEKLGESVFLNKKNGERYVVTKIGESKHNVFIDENGFTAKESAQLSKNIEDLKNGKGVTMTLEEFDAWCEDHGII
jgi:hypothetical protein